jgi:hypothetical protein
MHRFKSGATVNNNGKLKLKDIGLRNGISIQCAKEIGAKKH